jgi:hypothetical protein
MNLEWRRLIVQEFDWFNVFFFFLVDFSFFILQVFLLIIF